MIYVYAETIEGTQKETVVSEASGGDVELEELFNEVVFSGDLTKEDLAKIKVDSESKKTDIKVKAYAHQAYVNGTLDFSSALNGAKAELSK